LWIARGKNSSHGTLQAFNAALRHEPFSSHYSTMPCARALSKSLGLLALDDSPSGVAVGKEAGGLHEFAWSSVALRSPPAQWFLSAFRLALALVRAQAADLLVARRPAAVAPVVYAPPVYNWSGIYVGGNLGAGFAHSSWSDPFTGADNTFNKTGFIGGGQIGANWQIDALVLLHRRRFRLDRAQRQHSRFARQHHQHRHPMNGDGNRTHRRGVRSAVGLCQGRRHLCARQGHSQ